MGFRENLKAELVYQGLRVRELAERTQISKHTLDNYLNVNSYMPSAENAVKIARELGVSVEYLVLGVESPVLTNSSSKRAELRALVSEIEGLESQKLRVLRNLAKDLKAL
jgi:transcriptional regulator with XRE-family HTH domain